MATVRFYDLLGISTDAAAAGKWPADRVQGEVGELIGDADAVTLDLVRYLQTALEFRAVSPGAAPDRVGLFAEVVVKNPPEPLIRPIVLSQMPDIAFYLQNTVGVPGTSSYRPARLYITTADTGTELVIEGLPVEIRVPSGLLGPLREAAEEAAHPEGGPDVTLTELFQSGVYDSLQVTLRDAEEFSSIFVHVRVRMTEELDFIIEPAVPISIGQCRFNGLPCHGLHDITLVPSPRLHDEQPHEQALEWARHSINPFARWLEMSKWAGGITVRTVDLNAFREPLKALTDKLNEGRANNLKVEFVLNDVALPFFNLTGLPLPVHAEFGLRRPIVAGRDAAEAFNLTDPPIIRLGEYRVIVDQLLLRTPASLDPLDQFIFANLTLLRGGDTAPRGGTATIGITDDWTLQMGWRYPEARGVFTVADATIGFWGFKVGVSIGRWTSKTRYEWYEMLQVLADVGITTKGSQPFGGPFKLRSLTGKDIQIVARELGWNLGSFTLGGLSFPDGVQLIAFEKFRLIVLEIGWVNENNGATYFSVSGGIAFSLFERTSTPTAGSGTAAMSDTGDKGGGVLFHRLRFRTGGNPTAPAFLIDGVSVSLRFNRFKLTGLGMVNEFVAAGHEYKEFAIALEIEFRALSKNFLVGMQLFYGRVKGPEHNFKYWLFGVRLGFFPVSAFELHNVRVLAASNLTPNLPPPDANAQEMRIFRWYKASGDGAITLPSNRQLGSWRPVDESLVWGMGARTTTAGATVISCDLFCLGFSGPEGKGFLAALEIYFAKSAKPIGFAAIEWDIERDKIGILIGITLSAKNVLPEGVDLAFLEDLASITGTLFIGNQPGTVALGQLNDTNTWFSFRFGTNRFIDASVIVGFCVHYVNAPDGPRGFGFMFEAKGGKSFGIGKVQAYLTFLLIAGVWRNESVASGFVAYIEAGIRIKVFWVFNFGASARIEYDYLGPAPAYNRLGLVLKISTPWWLPDATLRVEIIDGQPELESMRAISTPMVASGAVEPGHQKDVPAAVTPITGGAIDERAVYNTIGLSALGDPPLSESAIAALAPVGVDSTIALEFKPALDDAITVGENTPPGAGTQAATAPAQSDLAVTYELIETGIRRRPRFGAHAGEWTTLLAPEDTILQTPADLPPDDELAAHFESAVSFQWDKSRTYQDHLDPRRLLVNADTPYTFLAEDAETDDVIVVAQPGWPCCVPDRRPLRWHELHFTQTPFGTRAPSAQRFSESSSTLHWTGARPPVVAPGIVAPASAHVARVMLQGRGAGQIASVSFDRPVFVFEVDVYWRAGATLGALLVTVYDGLDVVSSHTYPFSGASLPAPIRLQRLEGMTSLTLRLAGGTGFTFSTGPSGVSISAIALPPNPWLELVRMRYRTVQEELKRIAWDQKCRKQGERALEGGGRLAWLPNHDYEISVATKVTLAHERSGAQEVLVRQKAGFRTRGLPGLNAVARIGDELEPYVESRYPGPAPRTLYRSEPVMLAFNEKFNILLPVDRAPSPDNPDELNQILEWVLAVENVGSAVQGERVSQTGPDWVVAHRPAPLPPRPRGPRVIDGLLVSGKVREATTTDPFRNRFENLVHGPFGCGTTGPSLHRSQVLRHEPVDLAAAPGEAQRWEPGNTYRVNVRRKLGPFVERAPFDPGDAPAFDPATEGGGPPTQWTTQDGVMRMLTTAPADGARRLAVLGENDWNHVQIRISVDPEGGVAGVAVAVAGLPAVSRAAMALVDEASRTIRILERRNTVVTELASQPLPEGAAAPYALEVIAYDDKLRASVGEVVVEAARGELREGRLALVAQNGGAFHSLRVESLDAYRFQFQTSRFATFEEHINSYDGVLETVPVEPGATIAGLLTETSAGIAEAMAPGADPLARQALFDRWVSALALPLRRTPGALHISRVVRDDKTDMLVLESPEPLPFAEDVSLAIKHPASPQPPLPDGCVLAIFDFLTFRRRPAPPAPPPPQLPEPVRTLDFNGDRVSGPVASSRLDRARRLVRGVRAGNGAEQHVYDVSVRPNRRGKRVLTGRLVHVVRPGAPMPVPGLRPGEIAILDGRGAALVPVIPVDPVIWVEARTRILTNASETVALIIPVGVTPTSFTPLASGPYRLELALDRIRYRAQMPDAESNYRATATLTFAL